MAFGVGDAGRLDGTVHRELGAADVCHRDGQRVALQIAQRAAAGLVGAVCEHLHRHVGLPADGAEDRAADGVRRVLLAGVVL